MTEEEFQWKMKQEAYRLATFDCNWPHRGALSKERVANAGLYYRGPKDKVICPFCKLYIEHWEEGDDPLAEHKKLTQIGCPFLSNREGSGNVPLGQENMSTSYCKKECLQDAFDPPRDPHYDPARDPIDESMGDVTERMLSFTDWLKDNQKDPKELYEAGFYYTGVYDKVRCFSCGGYVEGWNKNDDPWVEHAKIHINCEFVVRNKSQFFIDQLNRNNVHAQERIRVKKLRLRNYAKNRGFSDYEIDAVLERAVDNPFENEGEMRDAINDMRHEDYNRKLHQADHYGGMSGKKLLKQISS